MLSKKIAILGAGVVGLTTAERIIEIIEQNNKLADKRLDITIIAESFGKDTTSDGAGGLFRPDDRFMKGVPKELAKQWVSESFKYFDKLLFSENGGKAGVFQASGYQMFDDERFDPSYKDHIYQFRHMTEEELRTFPRKFKYGYFSTTICIDTRTYMKYLTDKLTSKGVKFIPKKLDTLDSFINNHDFDIVFNCLGLGAIKFCNDDKMVPIRGQMIRVKAPWIKHYYYTDDNCYIIPNINTICLGGTRQLGNFSEDYDEKDAKEILRRCKELCPSLENAEIEWHWAGLRPNREPTRVEKEYKTNKNGNKITVIHNYGHGGNGISLSRGTSVHAVSLLTEDDSPLKSKI